MRGQLPKNRFVSRTARDDIQQGNTDRPQHCRKLGGEVDISPGGVNNKPQAVLSAKRLCQSLRPLEVAAADFFAFRDGGVKKPVEVDEKNGVGAVVHADFPQECEHTADGPLRLLSPFGGPLGD